MEIKPKNKGEWSEFYALLKLLAEKKLHAADQNLEKLEEIFYPLLNVITAQGSSKEINYELDDDENIKFLNREDGSLKTIKRQVIKDKISTILSAIKTGEGASFDIPIAKEIIRDLGNPVIKGYSIKKSDVVLKIHDINTGYKPEVGFSIKSQIGEPSTLLNAGEPTNFIFEVENFTLKTDEINAIDTHSKLIDRLKKIEDSGGRLNFVRVESRVFEDNLMKVDTLLPQLLAEMLKIYYRGGQNKIKDIVDELESRKFMLIPSHTPPNGFYEFKLKNLLWHSALGLTPATPWDGLMAVHGGYIIVREDGEVVCFHIYNQDAFRDYLYHNTRFEKAKSSRYKYMSIYKESGRFYIKLNLQIRFTN